MTKLVTQAKGRAEETSFWSRMEFKVQDREVVLDDNLAKLMSVLETLQTKFGETSEVMKDERKIKKNKGKNEKQKFKPAQQSNYESKRKTYIAVASTSIVDKLKAMPPKRKLKLLTVEMMM